LDLSRVIVAVILSLVLIFAYQELVLKRLYPPPSEQPAEKMKPGQPAAPSAIASAAPGAAATGAAPAREGIAAGEIQGAGPPPSERTIEVDTDLYAAQFTTRGARLKGFRLKRYNETASPDSGWYQIVMAAPGDELPLAALVSRAGVTADDRALGYSTTAPDRVEAAVHGETSIEFTAATADGNRITKTLTFKRGTYAISMDVAVADGPAPDEVGVALSQSLVQRSAAFRDLPELQADVANKVITESEDKLRKGVPPVTGAVTYAGFGDRYFLTAYLPESPVAATVAMSYENDQAFMRMFFQGAPRIRTRIYIGPKLLEALEAVNPLLNNAIDFGWLGFVALPFLRILKSFHFIAPNYGVDIILLTVALRIVTLPMMIRSQRSMMKMQRLAPQIERLREKFKDEQERLQREMLDLYKRNHVSPLGGCLPMLIQFPIFIGLYEALLNAIELRHAPFMAWIKDLSAPDCFGIPWMPQLPYLHCHGIPVLVLLMGASTFLQQWMSPTSPDPNQQRMMMLTPLIFTVMFINFPAGLSLYYFSSNVLGVIQQFFLNREMKQYTPVTA